MGPGIFMDFLQELPIDELDCYRKASVWGMEDRDLKLLSWLCSNTSNLSTSFFCRIHASFRTFLSTLCGNGFLKMLMRWDWNLPGTAGTCWDCWDCWLPGLAADMGQPHWPLFEWPRDVHVSSLGQTRSAEIEAKGSLWAQQVLLQIVSFASGIVWQRETAPFESHQRTKLSQNGQMKDLIRRPTALDLRSNAVGVRIRSF